MKPPRRIRHAKLCTPCYTKAGRPKAVCTGCDQEFAKDVMQGRRCRTCVSQAAHDKRVTSTYSITPGDYKVLLAAQHGSCYICLRKPGKKRLAVDHRHSCCNGPTSCGECVRGLLCRTCNVVLGQWRDNPETARRAAQYLEDPPAQKILRR